MRQLNNSIINKASQDRDPSWCVACDASDRCSTCDFLDFGDGDCDNCDLGSEE
jgi:hypothetical protein